MTNPIEQWGLFELQLQGAHDGNPFLDVTLSATFSCGDAVINATGFYDGDGIYKIRCMPTSIGDWTYITHSNLAELDGKTGAFTSIEPSSDNHGPVSVQNQYHFVYADGTPYRPFGTTCYAWVHQGDALEEQTLQTLSEKPFNKMRMCIFPKYMPFNHNEPLYYPFERDADGANDLTRFNPAFFQHIEQRLEQLLALGIEADLIIWHPYDHWGYSEMDEATDKRYLRYIMARFGAYRHVWWSVANEYNFLLHVKPIEMWDAFLEILQTEDPYNHLRSIHSNVNGDYDNTKPTITHASMQNWDVKRTKEWRETFGKPIVNDELEYEGDIPFPWGNISADEQVHRFWITVVSGGYAGHGETYMHPDAILWWAKGGVLHGDSWRGIGFLRDIIEASPTQGLTPIHDVPNNGMFDHDYTQWYWARFSGGVAGDYYLIYLGEHQMSVMTLWPKDDNYTVDIIDTREMTITPTSIKPLSSMLKEQLTFKDFKKPPYYIELPAKPYMAVRIQRA